MGASGSAGWDVAVSLPSSRLFFSVSSRSTRSLLCSSSWRRDSRRARSVEEEGRVREEPR